MSQGTWIRDVRMYYEFISLGDGKCYATPSVLPRIFLRDRDIFLLVVLTGFYHKMGGGQN